jgi:hypothetical protein
MGQMRNAYKIFVGKHKEKMPLARPSGRWEDSIEMDIREIECDGWNGIIWLGRVTSGGFS